MPLPEFYRMAEGKIEATQPKTTDISHVPENEFVELVWENGQVMMQGQTSRARKTPVSSNFQFHTPKFQDREIRGTDTSKMGKFGAMGSCLNVPIPVPSVDIGLNQDDDMVPWLNYPLDDPLEQDFCSNFLPEISGVAVNEPSNNNTFGLTDKRGSCNQTVRDSHSVSVHHGSIGDQGNTSKSSSLKANHIFPWTLNQGQTLATSRGSGVLDIISYNTRNSPSVICGDLAQGQSSSDWLPRLRLPNQDSGLPCSSSNLLNFSHFSRPVAMARANIQNGVALADCSSSVIERMGNNDKPFVPNNNVPVEVKLDGPSCVFQKEMGFHGQSSLVQLNGDSKPLVSKPLEESRSGEQSDTSRRGDAITDKSPNLVLGTMAAKGVPDSDKNIEPIVTTSSVCSGNNAERASNDLTKNLKRKRRDTEESECQSEDVEEESLGGKKAGFSQGGTGSKRSRAAEVHNLSERRRRDRINEKMRTLQELIPNCNKVDKASMLDEAIEYLKTLQLQVQIMSMGTGLCMPPMMFSAGMQHMHAAHVPHYSHMGVGMGMGMGIGFGMGMLDMNGGSHGRPVMPVPPMQGQRYPSPPIPSLSSFQGVLPGSNLQMFGHPGQGIPMPFPQGSMAPMPVRPPLNPAAEGSSASRVGPGPHVEGPNIASDLLSKDLIENASTQTLHNADTNKSMNQTPKQLRGENEGFKNDQAPDVGVSAAVLTNSSDPTLSRGTGSD